MSANNSELRIVPTYFGNTRSQFNVLVHSRDDITTEYFIPKEFGDAMGCTNARKIVRKHCPNMKRIGDFSRPERFGPAYSMLNDPKTQIVEEDELYEFLFACNLPKAKLFRKWVCKEVLPQIRGRGFFAMPGVDIFQQQQHDQRQIGCDIGVHEDRMNHFRTLSGVDRSDKRKETLVETNSLKSELAVRRGSMGGSVSQSNIRRLKMNYSELMERHHRLLEDYDRLQEEFEFHTA